MMTATNQQYGMKWKFMEVEILGRSVYHPLWERGMQIENYIKRINEHKTDSYFH